MVNTPNSQFTPKNNFQLDAEYLIQQLSQFALQHNIKTWCLAYSGGVDSQVLLHLLSLTKLNVSAIYIDHGLQAQSVDWAEHCRQQCDQYDIAFQVIKVNALPTQGESPEAAARTVRYKALKQQIADDSCLLTAQHQDDQGETILIQLLRGGGAAGLAGMPDIAKFAKGWHARPLLNITRKSILTYASKHQLSWVEDPTNQHENFDRNYLRHSVLAKISQRWPAVNKTLQIFAHQQAENSQLLDALAEIDLRACLLNDNTLDICQLNKNNDARVRNTIRYWLKSMQLKMPSRSVLGQIVEQMLTVPASSTALVGWADIEIRCFRNKLYCLKKMNHDASQVYKWPAKNSLFIKSIQKKLSINQMQPEDEAKFSLNKSVLSLDLIVRFRQGGEHLKPAGRNAHHDLKYLFQEAAVPPWLRDKTPLIYGDGELIAIAGYYIADEFSSLQSGLEIRLDDCME